MISSEGVDGKAVRARVLTALAAALLGCGETAPEAGTPTPRRAGLPNVLLVTVDTLRADHLGCYGAESLLTPRIDALAAEGLRFASAYSPAPFTLPAVGALMTGRYPDALGLRHNLSRVPVGTPTLAARLHAGGYATGAVVSNPVLAARSRLDDGFEHYDAEISDREANRNALERTAAATTDAALEMLARLEAPDIRDGRDRGPRPFFLWVHYQDPHGPYTPPDGLRERYLAAARSAPDGRRKLSKLDGWRGQGGLPAYQYIAPEREAGWYRAGYAGEIRHVDDEFGRLLESLERSGQLDETLVVFTADHGEGLGERDYWFAHGEYLDDAAVRVPLIVRGPGIVPGVREEAVSLVDVLSTISALLSLPADESAPGIDLLAEGDPDPDRGLYASTSKAAGSRVRRAIVAGGFKLVREEGVAGPREALYRLPDEQTDLSAVEPERRRALSRRLDTLIPRRERPSAPPLAPTDREREALTTLGYVVDDAGDAE